MFQHLAKVSVGRAITLVVIHASLMGTRTQAATPLAQDKPPERGDRSAVPSLPVEVNERESASPRSHAAPASTLSASSPKPEPAGASRGRMPRGADLSAVLAGHMVPAATTSFQTAMDIGSKIVQQVQPCANRQLKPGPGAERIRVVLHLKLNRDGSLIGEPEVVSYDGVDDGNRRYLDHVKNNAIAIFKGCAPIRGLPPELYDVPRGWSDFKIRYKLPG